MKDKPEPMRKTEPSVMPLENTKTSALAAQYDQPHYKVEEMNH